VRGSRKRNQGALPVLREPALERKKGHGTSTGATARFKRGDYCWEIKSGQKARTRAGERDREARPEEPTRPHSSEAGEAWGPEAAMIKKRGDKQSKKNVPELDRTPRGSVDGGWRALRGRNRRRMPGAALKRGEVSLRRVQQHKAGPGNLADTQFVP